MKPIKLFQKGLWRVAVLALAALMLLPLLCACDGDKTDKTPTNTDATDEASAATLNGVSIGKYEIRYAWRGHNQEPAKADLIKKALYDAFRINVKVDSDSKEVGEYVIMVGDSDRAGELTAASQSLGETDYLITCEGKTVYLLAKTAYGYGKVTEAFCSMIAAASESKAINVAKGSAQSYGDKQLNVMTFNIYNWDASSAHLERIKTVVKEKMPDVIGFQEMSNDSSKQWVDKLLADSTISATYTYIGASRGDSTGEQAPIFFNKSKFELVEKQMRWLYCEHGIKCTSADCKGSYTPGSFERTGKFSVDNGIYYRVFTYVKLRRIADGKEMAFINTHLEVQNYLLKTEANPNNLYEMYEVQNKQIDYILNFAKDLTDAGCPVIMTGDFNAEAKHTVCKKVNEAGFLECKTQATVQNGKPVPSGAQYASANKNMASSGLDHIFVKGENVYFYAYTYCDQQITVGGKADYPSDHLPHLATIVID